VIKPLETVDLPEGKEIVIYDPEEKEETEEYSEWTDEEWQKFSLHSFIGTEDDKDADWEDFFNYNLDDAKEKIAWAVTSANAVSEWKNPEEEEVWK
jgi:predicted DNA-binding antitoxin AbrB/MazE fold protein